MRVLKAGCRNIKAAQLFLLMAAIVLGERYLVAVRVIAVRELNPGLELMRLAS